MSPTGAKQSMAQLARRPIPAEARLLGDPLELHPDTPVAYIRPPRLVQNTRLFSFHGHTVFSLPHSPYLADSVKGKGWTRVRAKNSARDRGSSRSVPSML